MEDLGITETFATTRDAPVRSFIPGFLARVDHAGLLVYHMNNNNKAKI